MIAPRRKLIPVMVMIGLASCTENPDPAAPESPTSASVMTTATVSGQVVTNAGDPLCSAVENNAKFILGLYGEDYTATLDIVCPDDSFSFVDVPSGDYWLAWQRRLLNPAPGERLPQFWTTGPITIAEDATVNLRLRGVREVHGRALFQHGPNEFARLIVYDSDFVFDDNLEAARFVSNSDGDWVDPRFPGTPLFLQFGHGYTAFCDGGLGTRTSIHAFDVPDVRNLSCRSQPSRFVPVSHEATGLILTPEPGNLNTYPWDPYFVGFGWGVQFQDGEGPSTSRDANLLFEGSLVVALDNGVILSGGYSGDCTHCEDFANIRNLGRLNIGGDRRRITWQYDDDSSGEGVGLRVRQRSYDGSNGNYVFFHFTFENTSDETLTFNPGMYMDWDIGDFEDNNGGTEFDGHVMYATDPDGDFPYVATGILNRDAAGNYFLNPDEDLSVALQADAMRGTVRRESATASDVAYFHSSESIVLRPGRREGLWMVIVAAESLPALRDAADTALEEWISEASITSAAVSGINLPESTGDTWLPVPQRSIEQPAERMTVRRKNRPDQPSSPPN